MTVPAGPGWKQFGETEPGPHGGKAACGQVTAGGKGIPALSVALLTECAWQTEHTYGCLTMLGSSPPEELAAVTRLFRDHVEKPA